MPAQMGDAQETALRARVRGAALADYIVDQFPGLLTPREIMKDMVHQLAALPRDDPAW